MYAIYKIPDSTWKPIKHFMNNKGEQLWTIKSQIPHDRTSSVLDPSKCYITYKSIYIDTHYLQNGKQACSCISTIWPFLFKEQNSKNYMFFFF